MGSFRFPVPSSIALVESFGDMPQSMRTYLKTGFLVLSRVSEDKFPVLANIAVRAAQAPYRVEIDEAAKQLGINTDDMGSLLPAISFLTTFVSSRSEGPDQLVSAAVEANVIPEASRQVVLRFSQALAMQREGLRHDLQKARLANQVLPSMIDFEIVVDIRLHPSKSELNVPVAIAHLDTDAAHTEVWFQMQKGDVERLIDTLQKIARQMAEAEKLYLGQRNHDRCSKRGTFTAREPPLCFVCYHILYGSRRHYLVFQMGP